MDDFKSYIKQELNIRAEESYRGEISSRLLARVSGNFLWLHLAVQRINNCHTRQDIEDDMALLPGGMEALYDRMELSVRSQVREMDRRLGHDILSWATCGWRPLKIEELSDVLGDRDILDIDRTINVLCGGFVTVDDERRVVLVHETAREYLTTKSNAGSQSPAIDQASTNCQLLTRCLEHLEDPALRGHVSKDHEPAFLGYATEAWFVHFARSPITNSDALQVVGNFLQSSHVLTWIYAIAKRKKLEVLVVASRWITDVVVATRSAGGDGSSAYHNAIIVIQNWATDLIRIVGRFGNALKQDPGIIYENIPPFCPETSAIYQQFGRRDNQGLRVSGTKSTWDDFITSFRWDHKSQASAIVSRASRIAISTHEHREPGTTPPARVLVYDAATFEEKWQFVHPDDTCVTALNELGSILVSSGKRTTQVWDVVSGECIKTMINPTAQNTMQSMVFRKTR